MPSDDKGSEEGRIDDSDEIVPPGGTGSSDNDVANSLFHGVVLERNVVDGRVVAMTTAGRRDQDRWEITTPSLGSYPDLHLIDFSKCRYLKCVDDSLTRLQSLRTLRLTRCSRLQRLPEAVGMLETLEEVGGTSLACFFQRGVYICLSLD